MACDICKSDKGVVEDTNNCTNNVRKNDYVSTLLERESCLSRPKISHPVNQVPNNFTLTVNTGPIIVNSNIFSVQVIFRTFLTLQFSAK